MRILALILLLMGCSQEDWQIPKVVKREKKVFQLENGTNIPVYKFTNNAGISVCFTANANFTSLPNCEFFDTL